MSDHEVGFLPLQCPSSPHRVWDRSAWPVPPGVYGMSHWARAHTPLPFFFHDWISTLSPNFKRQGGKVKWDFLAWRLNIVVGKQKAYHFCWYFLTPLLRCKVVFENCIWHIARYLFIAAALGPQVPSGSYLLFHCSVRNCLSSPCECEIVWRGPVPGLQCLAQLQEAALRFALGQVEPHGHQPPRLLVGQWTQLLSCSFLPLLHHTFGPCHLVFEAPWLSPKSDQPPHGLWAWL